MFYVISAPPTASRSWVLNLEGYADRKAAAQAIAWQAVGGSDPAHFAICRYDGRSGMFVSYTPGPAGGVCRWAPDSGPYTADAWRAFVAKLGGRLATVEALAAAESFLEGFADDPTQDQSALALVRAALADLDGEG